MLGTTYWMTPTEPGRFAYRSGRMTKMIMEMSVIMRLVSL